MQRHSGRISQSHTWGKLYTTRIPPRPRSDGMLEKYSMHVLLHDKECGAIPVEFRINYGVSWAVYHDEKVVDVGIVDTAHKQLLFDYCKDSAYDEDD
jgi:hypothetical protein